MPEPFVLAPRRVPSGHPSATVVTALDPAFGPLAEHIADEQVTDVFVNGTEGLFIDRGDGAERMPQWRASEREVRDLAVVSVAAADVTSTTSRRAWMCGWIPASACMPCSPRCRRLARRCRSGCRGCMPPDLDALAALGTFAPGQQRWLESLVPERANVLITGGTGTGKTTLLTALLSAVPTGERIVTIEDAAELRPRHPHHVSLEARQPNLEGAGRITLAMLVRESLRMRSLIG